MNQVCYMLNSGAHLLTKNHKGVTYFHPLSSSSVVTSNPATNVLTSLGLALMALKTAHDMLPKVGVYQEICVSLVDRCVRYVANMCSLIDSPTLLSRDLELLERCVVNIMFTSISLSDMGDLLASTCTAVQDIIRKLPDGAPERENLWSAKTRIISMAMSIVSVGILTSLSWNLISKMQVNTNATQNQIQDLHCALEQDQKHFLLYLDSLLKDMESRIDAIPVLALNKGILTKMETSMPQIHTESVPPSSPKPRKHFLMRSLKPLSSPPSSSSAAPSSSESSSLPLTTIDAAASTASGATVKQTHGSASTVLKLTRKTSGVVNWVRTTSRENELGDGGGGEGIHRLMHVGKGNAGGDSNRGDGNDWESPMTKTLRIHSDKPKSKKLFDLPSLPPSFVDPPIYTPEPWESQPAKPKSRYGSPRMLNGPIYGTLKPKRPVPGTGVNVFASARDEETEFVEWYDEMGSIKRAKSAGVMGAGAGSQESVNWKRLQGGFNVKDGVGVGAGWSGKDGGMGGGVEGDITLVGSMRRKLREIERERKEKEKEGAEREAAAAEAESTMTPADVTTEGTMEEAMTTTPGTPGLISSML